MEKDKHNLPRQCFEKRDDEKNNLKHVEDSAKQDTRNINIA